MEKPTIHVLPDGKNDALPAAWLLANLDPAASFHVERDWRHPLGVYNISISRICRKITKCAELLRENWQMSQENNNKLSEEIIDYLELVIYAAAEHVDDTEQICKTLFRSDVDFIKSPLSRKLRSDLKPLRDEISNIANTIKHAHGRIRLLTVDFVHGGETIELVGFFIEGVKHQALGPHQIIHSKGKLLISVTSFLWNVMTYLSEISLIIREILIAKNAAKSALLPVFAESYYGETAFALAKIPLYSFDEIHPFVRVTWSIQLDQASANSMGPSIYGSIVDRWKKNGDGKITQTRTAYSGDGISNNFSIIQPSSVNLLYWE